MKSKFVIYLLFFLLLLPKTVIGQKTGNDILIQGTITSKVDGTTLIGVSVAEIDASNRVVSGNVTDMNGHFVLKIKNPDNKLQFSYIGFVKQALKIEGKRVFNIAMSDNT